jgi:hypothetical protein
MKTSGKCLAVTCAIPLTLLVACGEESQADRGAGDGRGSATKGNSIPPACFKARTELGDRPGQVDYTLHCRSKSTDNPPSFGIGRYSLAGKSERPGIRRVERHPRVDGSGAVRPFGVCSRSGSVVYCSARADGAVAIKGSIWVSPVSRCAMGVSVTVPLVRRCGKDECVAQGGRPILADGRPFGCAQALAP